MPGLVLWGLLMSSRWQRFDGVFSEESVRADDVAARGLKGVPRELVSRWRSASVVISGTPLLCQRVELRECLPPEAAKASDVPPEPTRLKVDVVPCWDDEDLVRGWFDGLLSLPKGPPGRDEGLPLSGPVEVRLDLPGALPILLHGCSLQAASFEVGVPDGVRSIDGDVRVCIEVSCERAEWHANPATTPPTPLPNRRVRRVFTPSDVRMLIESPRGTVDDGSSVRRAEIRVGPGVVEARIDALGYSPFERLGGLKPEDDTTVKFSLLRQAEGERGVEITWSVPVGRLRRRVEVPGNSAYLETEYTSVGW